MDDINEKSLITDYQYLEEIITSVAGMPGDVMVVTPNGGRFIIHPDGRNREVRDKSFLDDISPISLDPIDIAGALLLPPILVIPLYLLRRSYLKKSEKIENEEADNIAQEIAKKYNVSIVIVETDQEYYSDEVIQKGAEDKVYFISRENPKVTGDTTEYLLRHMRFKYKSPMETANAKRIEQATQKSIGLNEKIEEIKKEFKEGHNNVEPSLSRIAVILNELNIDPPGGGNAKWFAQTVKRVLEKTQVSEQLR